MTKMGTVAQAVNTILGALGSPIDGLFISGIFAPWVNATVFEDSIFSELILN